MQNRLNQEAPRMPDLADTTTEVRLQSDGCERTHRKKCRVQADLTAVNWDTKEVRENVWANLNAFFQYLSMIRSDVGMEYAFRHIQCRCTSTLCAWSVVNTDLQADAWCALRGRWSIILFVKGYLLFPQSQQHRLPTKQKMLFLY